jgi:hypothetical protein
MKCGFAHDVKALGDRQKKAFNFFSVQDETRRFSRPAKVIHSSAGSNLLSASF